MPKYTMFWIRGAYSNYIYSLEQYHSTIAAYAEQGQDAVIASWETGCGEEVGHAAYNLDIVRKVLKLHTPMHLKRVQVVVIEDDGYDDLPF